MELHIKEKFIDFWKLYFPTAGLPLIFYHSDEPNQAELASTESKGWHCFIGDLAIVLKGRSMCYSQESLGCGIRFLGFTDFPLRANFSHFLSCGIPGKLEGERYKRTPELVEAWKKQMPEVPSDKKYVVFKRWDNLIEPDHPEVVIFFATPDVLSGLYTWVNFDESDPEMVAAPFGAGCASIVQYPLIEAQKENPRAILGMFDVSARPRVKSNILTLAIPWKKFVAMLDCADETFFTTKSWDKVKKRIAEGSGL